MVDQDGPHYFVVFHSPGPKWLEGTPYNEQPEFFRHVEYISGLQDKGKIVLSGPFMKKPGGLTGELSDGGMAILRAADIEEAAKLGTDDPTVQSGMLKVEIKTFWVPFQG
ncbi:YciI family protein [Nostoc sp.]|uniref:YciI family protein n=1 Tax=Nostoc sp. TaxID=1180 RepID=UPI002FF7BD11